MKKLTSILLVYFVAIQVSSCQIVKVQLGENWSHISGVNGKQLTGYSKPFLGKDIFIGFEYLNNRFFNLSSNLGYLNKKAHEDYIVLRPNGGGSDLVVNKTDLGFLSINTTFDLKYPIKDRFFPFISIGPRFDYLIINNSESTMEIMNSLVSGFTLGGGLKFRVSKIFIGARVDHYWNFYKSTRIPVMPSYTGFSSPQDMTEKTLLVSFSIAYKLK